MFGGINLLVQKQLHSCSERLADAIRRRYGALTRTTLQELSQATDVALTSLLRLFIYRRTRQERARTGRKFITDKPRRDTIEKLAAELGENPVWIADGVGARQLSFWPLITPEEIESTKAEPLQPAKVVLECLEALSPELQATAARAAVAAIIGEAVAARHLLPLHTYKALAGLDRVLWKMDTSRPASA